MTACPKPAPKPKRVARPIPKTRLKKKSRPAAETLRIYGGKARIEFVKSLPCIAGFVSLGGTSCDRLARENAHVSTGGMGRKSDAANIVPLCARHHEQLHRWGRGAFEFTYALNLETCAAETEADWQEHKQASAA